MISIGDMYVGLRENTLYVGTSLFRIVHGVAFALSADYVA